MLKNVGSTIGPVLRIDAHIVNGARGRFARICVQINIDKPLINLLRLGRWCNQCNTKVFKYCALRVDALVIKKKCCPSLVRGPELVVENQGNSSSETNLSPKEASTNKIGQEDGKADTDDVYGDWMVVK